MSDYIAAGTTWRRTVTISDTDGPVDPTDMTAIMCPEIPLTLTNIAPGEYQVSLTEQQTATLPHGEGRWELWGRIGSDLTIITRQSVHVYEVCGP